MTRRSRRRRRPKKSSSNNVNVTDDEGDGERPNKELYGLILKEKFDEASARCRTHPQDAMWDGYKHSLPIHLACDGGAPLTLIRNLHESYPGGVRTKDDGGWLPLHVACANESLDVIRYLHHQYPDGATQRDLRGLTPVDWLRVRNNKKLVGKEKATARAVLSPTPTGAAAAAAARTPSSRKQPTTTTAPRDGDPAEDDATTTTSKAAAAAESITATTTSAAAAAATTNNTTSRSGGGPHSHVTRLEEHEVVEVANNLGAEVEAAAATDEDVSEVEAGVVSTEKPEAAKAEAEATASAAADATVSAEELEAAEAVSGASGDASMKAREEVARKRATGKEEARFGHGRRKAKVTDWNANRLRREAEVARRGNLRRTAVAANNRLARAREEEYETFAEDREKLSTLPFFFESSSTGHNRSPSVVLHDPPP